MKIAPFLYLIVLFSLSGCSSDSKTTDKDEKILNSAPKITDFSYKINSIAPYEIVLSVEAEDADGDQLSYLWDFGDGTTLEGGPTQTKTFSANGSFEISVEVSDGEYDLKSTLNIQTKVSTVNVDTNVSYQNISGFGGFGAMKTWWSSEPFFDSQFIDKVVNELGITILRDNIPVGFEPVNDNDDPFDLDLTKFNITTDVQGADSHLGQHLPYLRAMREAGVEKFITSIWSPPSWMKHNNSVNNGVGVPTPAPGYTQNPDETTNQLKEDLYQEFAEYCVAYIKMLKMEADIDLYAISLQNEPRFSQTFASCVHSFESLKNLIKVVGARFQLEGITTKIFMPEDVKSLYHIEGYVNEVLEDPSAKNFVDIIAIHNYALDGVNPGDEGPNSWVRTRELANLNNSEVWMTETSGFDDSWQGAFDLGLSIYNALQFGQANAWLYWQMSNGNDSPLIVDGVANKRFYVSKNYYKFIKPGATSVKATSDSDQLLTLAFTHTVNGNETMILINNSNNDTGVVLTGDFKENNFKIFTTSENLDCEQGTDVVGSSGVYVPAKSIVTLTN